ncbi:MAG: class I SAM-dependent methyltransferase [Saprospiraceae bacterium]
MKMFLNLEWIFHRLAHEQSFALYTEENHPVRAKTRSFLLPLIKGDHVVLDLGCKEGVMSNYLASKAKKVVGIDYDAEAIGRATSKYDHDNIEFKAVEALAFLDSTTENFDVLILSHILEHLDHPKKFLKSFKDYFKYVYIEVPDFDRYYMNHYRKDLNMKLVYSDDDHISEFDREELTAILSECNLLVLKTDYRYGVQKYWCVHE